ALGWILAAALLACSTLILPACAASANRRICVRASSDMLGSTIKLSRSAKPLYSPGMISLIIPHMGQFVRELRKEIVAPPDIATPFAGKVPCIGQKPSG